MAKKSVRKTSKKEFDFFFLVVVSVFTALTVLTASFLTRSKQEFAARQRALDVAQLELIEAEASPLPTTKNVAPRK
jgi:hypothetical protein